MRPFLAGDDPPAAVAGPPYPRQRPRPCRLRCRSRSDSLSITCSAISAIARKPIRPAMNASSAISLAAVQHGALQAAAFHGAVAQGGSPESAPRPAPRNPAGRAWRNRAARHRSVGRVGIGQRIADGGAHVGAAELGKHRTVGIADHRMDDRLRMDDHLDLVRAGGRRGAWPRSSPAPC